VVPRLDTKNILLANFSSKRNLAKLDHHVSHEWTPLQKTAHLSVSFHSHDTSRYLSIQLRFFLMTIARGTAIDKNGVIALCTAKQADLFHEYFYKVNSTFHQVQYLFIDAMDPTVGSRWSSVTRAHLPRSLHLASPFLQLLTL
jgi:hypothetical protein